MNIFTEKLQEIFRRHPDKEPIRKVPSLLVGYVPEHTYRILKAFGKEKPIVVAMNLSHRDALIFQEMAIKQRHIRPMPTELVNGTDYFEVAKFTVEREA